MRFATVKDKELYRKTCEERILGTIVELQFQERKETNSFIEVYHFDIDGEKHLTRIINLAMQ